VAEGEGGSLEAKLDQILKKLGADDDQQALDKLREELERLRKEVDSLKNK
jgi:polyhydroxyalkanoate synthesis regulator phasin